MATKQFEPIHPGEILEEEFMRPPGLSANALARGIDVPVTRVSEIVRGKRGITADTALRLGRFFGTSSDFWLKLQAEYDLRAARRDLSEAGLKRIVPLHKSASYGAGVRAAQSDVGERIETYGRVNALRRDRDRRRMRRSLAHPHPESVELAEAGLEEWGAESIPSDDSELLDIAAGKPIRWEPGKGWLLAR